MTLIRVKVTNIDFTEAENNGFVFGLDRDKRINNVPFSVYVKLGKEKQYDYKDWEDLSLQYRFFTKCTIFYAESDEKADAGEFIAMKEMKDIAIYV